MQALKRLIPILTIVFSFVSISCIGAQDRATANSPWLASDPKLVCIDGDYAYVAHIDGPLVVVDLANPAGPDIVGFYGLEENPLRINTCGDYLYACSPSGKLDVINVGSPFTPASAGMVQIRSGVDDFFVLDGYAYIADEKLRIIDVDPPQSAYLVKEVDTSSGPCRIFAADGFAYVAGTGTVRDMYGVQKEGFVIDIIAIDPPENARIVRTLDMFSEYWDGCFAVSNGYMYVLSRDFYVVDIDPLDSAMVVGSCAIERPATGITVTDEYAYLTSGGTVQIIDLLMKDAPRFVETRLVDDRDVQTIKVAGEYISVTGRPGGLKFIRPD